MQVAAQVEQADYIAIGGGKAEQFKIAQSAHAIQILSSTLYSNKPLAVAREYICNAVDAHRKVGNKEPIRISIENNIFVVEDKGPGIPHDKIGDIFCTYFASTKTDDASQIGGFGLGCKAAFAMTDDFTVINKHGGKKAIYSISKGNDESGGMPVFKKMIETDTEETGVTVKVPFDKTESGNIDQAILRILRDGGFCADYMGNKFEEVDWSEGYKSGFMMIKRPVYDARTDIFVRYGDILYPVESKNEYWAEARRLVEILHSGELRSMAFALCAQPGEISITPSREALSYDESTMTWLTTKLTQMSSHLDSRRLAARKKLLKVALRQSGTSFYELPSCHFGHLPLIYAELTKRDTSTLEGIITYIAAHDIDRRVIDAKDFVDVCNEIYHTHRHKLRELLIGKTRLYRSSDLAKSDFNRVFSVPLILRVFRKLNIPVSRLIARINESYDRHQKYVTYENRLFFTQTKANLVMVKSKSVYSSLIADDQRGYLEKNKIPHSGYVVVTDGLPSQKVDELVVELSQIKSLQFFPLHEFQPTWQTTSKRFRKKESTGYYRLVLSDDMRRSSNGMAHMLQRPVSLTTHRPLLPVRVDLPVAYVPLPPVRGRGDQPAVVISPNDRGYFEQASVYNKALRSWEEELCGPIVVPFTKSEAEALKARGVPSLVTLLVEKAKRDDDRVKYIRSTLFEAIKSESNITRAVYHLTKRGVDVFHAAYGIPHDELLVNKSCTTETIRTLVSMIGEGFTIDDAATIDTDLAELRKKYSKDAFTVRNDEKCFEVFRSKSEFEQVFSCLNTLFEIVDYDSFRYRYELSEDAKKFLFDSIRKMARSSENYKENKRRLLGVADKPKRTTSKKLKTAITVPSNTNTDKVELELAA